MTIKEQVIYTNQRSGFDVLCNTCRKLNLATWMIYAAEGLTAQHFIDARLAANQHDEENSYHTILLYEYVPHKK